MFRYRTVIQNLLLLFLILICSQSAVQADEIRRAEPKWWVGFASGGNLNFYNGRTQMLNSTLTAPTPYFKGYFPGFYAALMAEYRPDPAWGAMMYVGYDDRRGLFQKTVTSGGTSPSLYAKISYLTLEPSLRITSRKTGIYIFAGPRIGINLKKDFTYKVQTDPTSTTEGEWSDIRPVVFNGQVGIGYDVTLITHRDKTQLNFSPFISFHPYFGQNPRSVETWNVSTFRVGVALKVGQGRVLPPIVKEAIAVLPDPVVSFSVRAPKVVPVKRKVRETFPLRNYVFFEPGSTEIPNRYVTLSRDQAAKFNEDQLQEIQPVDMTGRSQRQSVVYYNILNILGDRMSDNPSATVELTGASAKGPDDGRAIAESVKKYLVDVFGISASRIKTEGRNKPRIPSAHEGGKKELALLNAEDRRVDIESRSPELLMQVGGPPDLLKPVQIVTVQDDPLDSHVIFYVTGASEALSSWSLEVIDEDAGVRKFGPFTQDWTSIPGKEILGDRETGDFRVVMRGHGKNTRLVQDESWVHLVRVEEPKPEGLRFSILLEFDQSKTIATYENFLVNMVAPLIPEDGTVIIHGHTDVIGEDAYNQKLSSERAIDAQKVIEGALQKAGKKRVNFQTYGFGEDTRLAPFENHHPEGRFYNRTVIIDIVPDK